MVFRVPISFIARALSGDAACLYRLWAELRAPRSTTPDPHLVAHRARHARAVHDLVARLPGVATAERVVWDRHGLYGRVDVLEELPEGVVVHEVKTGRAGNADAAQLLLYMALLEEQTGRVHRGVLHRPGGSNEWSIRGDAIPDGYLELARGVAARLLSEDPPRAVRGAACEWCRVACPLAPQEGEIRRAESPTAR